VTLAMLANMLAGTVGRPVIDRTGVPPQEPSPRSDAPSLFTAVQEQLGLKVDSTRAPVEVIVIDKEQE